MLDMLNKKQNCVRPFVHRVEHTPQGLAITPSRMMQNAAAGIPIASQLLDDSYFDDGTFGSVAIDQSFTRGYSVIDAWNASLESKNKLRNAQSVYQTLTSNPSV